MTAVLVVWGCVAVVATAVWMVYDLAHVVCATPARPSAEEHLRADYVEGRIEIDEFERRLAAMLAGHPDARDFERSALGVVLKEAWTDRPGQVFHYDPAWGVPRTHNDILMLQQRIAAARKPAKLAHASQISPENPHGERS